MLVRQSSQKGGLAMPPLRWTEQGWQLDASVTGVTIDSRQVRPGYIFVATHGQAYDGHDFVGEAVSRGAVAVVGERRPVAALPVPYFCVPSGRVEAAKLACRLYNDPSHDLTVVGVTGTNGKTSVVFWLTHLLRFAGRGTGMLSSVVNDLGQQRLAATLTTPESPDLQRYLAAIRDFGYRYAVVEVSSHGIVQHRIDGVRFEMAILTNITREHLDFHKTMANYVAAKALLFEELPENSAGAMLNADDPYREAVQRRLTAPVVTYGLYQADVTAEILDSRPWYTDVRIRWREQALKARLNHPGRYNVSNLLAAVGAALRLGVEPAVIAEAIPALPEVPGRMHMIEVVGGPKVIVDYAHTPDGLYQTLITVQDLHPAHLWLVFGARGGRDHGKRPEMGRIAARWADWIVLTSDSPGLEDPQAIADDLLTGIHEVDAGRLWKIELDRAQAIEEAVLQADAEDIILVTGRGPETYQRFGDQIVPFIDVEVAQKALDLRRQRGVGGRIERDGQHQRSHPGV